MKPRGVAKPIVLVLLGTLLLGLTAFLVYASLPYPAETGPLETAKTDASFTYTETLDGVVLQPKSGTGDGLVFLPGAHVAPEAYAAKLSGLAEAGVTVVIARPILNYAILDYRPLSTFEDLAPNVDRWFVGGHSLGGVRACLYAADGRVAGLALFGSYCSNDLSSTGLAVVTISSSKDGLSTPAKIADAKHLLPQDAAFVEIPGANHAQFGDYGGQPGDGTSETKDSGVRYQITEAVLALINRG